ncbi:MAG: pilus assembly protein PilP [Porticoccaceae bacterium]
MTILLSIISVGGCGGGGDQADLLRFMEEARSKPVGQIEPLPVFPQYPSFKYSAVAIRSPFEKPVTAIAEDAAGLRKAVKPDGNRKKEYLESINFASFTMVGALTRDGSAWALVDDGMNSVHRVTMGNYLGKNHGIIVSVNEDRVDVVEIVPDGKGGWVERPRTLALKEKN